LRNPITDAAGCCARAASGHAAAAPPSAADMNCRLPMPIAICPRLQSDEDYHALIGKSVTNFTVVRSLLLLRVRAAEIGP
jgi:hypothetical protein